MPSSESTELSTLLTRLDAAERRALRAERRGRARALLGGGALVLALALGSAPQAMARQLGVTLASLAAQVNALTTRTAALETKTQYQSVSGTSTIFRGTNVYIQSGAGATDGAVNGLGNLVVGYGENQYGFARTGSHNLVIGQNDGYTSYGGAVFGLNNRITSDFATVLGGEANLASGERSVVTGGLDNTASVLNSAVTGGYGNAASAVASVVGGGVNLTEARFGGWSASSSFHN